MGIWFYIKISNYAYLVGIFNSWTGNNHVAILMSINYKFKDRWRNIRLTNNFATPIFSQFTNYLFCYNNAGNMWIQSIHNKCFTIAESFTFSSVSERAMQHFCNFVMSIFLFLEIMDTNTLCLFATYLFS